MGGGGFVSTFQRGVSNLLKCPSCKKKMMCVAEKPLGHSAHDMACGTGKSAGPSSGYAIKTRKENIKKLQQMAAVEI